MNDFISYDEDDDHWRYIMIGQTWRYVADPPCTINSKIYYDNIYIDDTQARVELANSIVLEEASIRELQIPNNWDSEEIEVKTNLGKFEEGTVYFFVINSSGEVSPGYPVELGEIYVDDVPSPPRDGANPSDDNPSPNSNSNFDSGNIVSGCGLQIGSGNTQLIPISFLLLSLLIVFIFIRSK